MSFCFSRFFLRLVLSFYLSLSLLSTLPLSLLSLSLSTLSLSETNEKQSKILTRQFQMSIQTHAPPFGKR